MENNLDQPLPGYNYFIVMWDNQGLERIEDLGEIYYTQEKESMQAVWDVLSNKNPKKKQSLNTMLGRIITPMMLRARVNHQRNYEIYTLRTTSDIDVHDLRQMFESDPQHAADLIRVRGNKLFCNRRSSPPVIV